MHYLTTANPARELSPPSSRHGRKTSEVQARPHLAASGLRLIQPHLVQRFRYPDLPTKQDLFPGSRFAGADVICPTCRLILPNGSAKS